MDSVPSGTAGAVAVGGGVSLATSSWQPAASAPGAAPGAAPFVLLHGIAASARNWGPVAERLAAAGHSVVALDFRGHGLSDRPETGYDLATYASDLTAAVAELGLARPFLAGHSLGAMVILETAARRPNLARGVALVEGGLVDASLQFATLEECLARMTLPPVGGMPAPRVEGFLRATNPGWSAERLAAAMAAFDVQADGTVQWRLTPPRVKSLTESMWRQHAPELWPAVQVPTLIIAADTGDAPWTAQKREAAAAAKQVIAHVRVEWLSGDHAIHEAQPDAIAALLLAAAGSAA
jgi:pimeloyl-ACP methyl ester carboxylesterase